MGNNTEFLEGTGQGRPNRQQARWDRIAEYVMQHGSVRIEELSEQLGVSVMTIHRDLTELENKGLLRKTRGQATAVATSLVEASTVYRGSRNRDSKRALSAAALELIEPGEAVVLDDSTTIVPLAERLVERAPLTVITPSLHLIKMMTRQPGITLLSLGGQYYEWADAFLGRVTVAAARELRADVCVMSTAAIVGDVCYHQMEEIVTVKQALLECAERKILLADHTKFTRRALHALMPLASFDVVIVDEQTPAAEVERLRGKGINVVVAPPVP
ncbi:DeoR/GlpR family DNA-binding transcription regulator [Microtetraspora niveoalba]|uniref:DeoR/GlpR family DNA-binding transcription regulator n=1 Tax=Microtetraspora niveoalba TaxID=46175 RepID=UPI000A6409FB|nr:DeoR/GlpR family DNA-binding transcription regulator [Microtetraspora niveoalba]